MIYEHDFIRDEKNQQIFPDFSDDFACLCRRAEASKILGYKVPWHHHPGMEINYVAEGSVTIRTSDHTFTANKGDAIFINSDKLHSTRFDPDQGGTLLVLVFDPVFLSGMYGNIYERKYLQPITQCANFQGFLLHPDEGRRMEMAQQLLQIFTLFKEEPYGYEFEVRALLGRFWCHLLLETEEIRKNLGTGEGIGLRMRPMLDFIHEKYPERIMLEDIAATGNVSSRECTRCFQKYTRLSPVNYLNYYRVRMAAHELLKSEKSIQEISESCGFNSPSYFSKVFENILGSTPGEFRKEHALS